MRPSKRTFAATGTYIIPLDTYSETGCSVGIDKNVTSLDTLIDRNDTTSVLDNATGTTAGTYKFTGHADAIKVVTSSADTTVTVLQYG